MQADASRGAVVSYTCRRNGVQSVLRAGSRAGETICMTSRPLNAKFAGAVFR